MMLAAGLRGTAGEGSFFFKNILVVDRRGGILLGAAEIIIMIEVKYRYESEKSKHTD